MRNGAVVFIITVFLFSSWGIVPSHGQAGETQPEVRTLLALDLMDLEIPGEDDGDEMALPPIQGSDKPEVEPPPVPDTPKPAETGANVSDFPPVSRSAPAAAPEPGLVPFLLEEPQLETETPRSVYETSPEPTPATLTDEFPAELKEVPPPPSRAESLKLHSGPEMRSAGESDVPEIPMLKGEGGGPQAPLGQDSALTMKPLPELRGTSSTSFGSRPIQAGRQPKDYLQVREDIDAQLFDLYERYYKSR